MVFWESVSQDHELVLKLTVGGPFCFAGDCRSWDTTTEKKKNATSSVPWGFPGCKSLDSLQFGMVELPFVSRGKKLFETNGDWILMLECGIFCSSSDLLLVLRFARGDCTKVVCHECWIVPAVSRSACRSQKTTVLSKKSLSLRSDVLFPSSEMAHQKREDTGRGHERAEGKVVGHPFPAPSRKSLSLRSDVLFPSSEMERRKNLVYDEPKARRRRSKS